MKKYLLSIVMMTCIMMAHAQFQLIPQPDSLVIKEGFYQLSFKIEIKSNGAPQEKKYLQEQFQSIVGKDVGISKKSQISLNVLPIKEPTDKQLESYTLSISKTGISIFAYTNTGVFRGIQTLLQLIEEHRDAMALPFVEISDAPRFSYRGTHLDVSRHFFTVDEVKQYLDYLAFYKLNKFHWHLTDDQGWRIEIKSHPKLTQIGGFRKESQIGPYAAQTFDGKPYGGFYTQDQIKEVVAYAQKLHIDVIPEIEMPGHALAALAAYPELSCTGGPFQVGTIWGVMDDIFCPKEETFKFLQDVIDEVVTLFPYRYLHIGGDEAPKTRWKACPHCQALIKKENLKDELELQSYFIKRMEKYINSKGKKIIGWDEILEGGLAPDATVMSWRGVQGAVHAAKTAHDAIMTPSSHLYFDHYQGNPLSEPLAIGGDTRLEKVYNFQPIPTELSEKDAQHILGAQANVWTEYIPDFRQVQYMVFPRIMALSEVVWGNYNVADYKSFENKVLRHFKILNRKNINYSKAILEVVGKSKFSDGQLFYELSTDLDPKNIRYTTDGSEPQYHSQTYQSPLLILKSQTIKASYFDSEISNNATVMQDFVVSKSTGKDIQLQSPSDEPYVGDGASTLVDAVFGSQNYFGKNYLGFNGKDVVAIINFGAKTNFTSVKIGSLDRQASWIYLPKSVKISVSDDNQNYQLINTLSQEDISKSNGNLILNFNNQNSKYIKVEIQNFGIIPIGSAGAGSSSWLFVDEISVN